jgi:hypothetical protein
MVLVAGNETTPSQAIGIDLGDNLTLSGATFEFSLAQILVGGRSLRNHPRQPPQILL